VRIYTIAVVAQEPFERFHTGSRISAPACPNQYVMPISCACSRWLVRR